MTARRARECLDRFVRELYHCSVCWSWKTMSFNPDPIVRWTRITEAMMARVRPRPPRNGAARCKVGPRVLRRAGMMGSRMSESLTASAATVCHRAGRARVRQSP